MKEIMNNESNGNEIGINGIGNNETEVKKYRLEHDSIGEKEVPIDAYYGVQTLRAHENFYITGLKNASGADQKCGADQKSCSYH